MVSSAYPENQVTQPFGAYNPKIEKFSGGVNRGVDISKNPGGEVKVPEGQWTVVESFGNAKQGNKNVNNGYGNSVLLRNLMTGEMVRYSHLQQVNTRPGQVVKTGELIATTGNTGNSTGPHLDVEYMNAEGKLGNFLKTKYSGSI